MWYKGIPAYLHEDVRKDKPYYNEDYPASTVHKIICMRCGYVHNRQVSFLLQSCRQEQRRGLT